MLKKNKSKEKESNAEKKKQTKKKKKENAQSIKQSGIAPFFLVKKVK
jgi:hypothetical protein